jgi:hypothetical protein
MNILDAEDMIKGLPDQTLMQQAQMPTGELPQFLVISEIQRRSDMRKRHEAQMQEQSQGTVKDQIMREGIAAMMPQQPMGMPPQMMPQGMPPQGMPPQGMPTGMPPMGMAAGGVVQMQRGGALPAGQYPLFDGSTIAEKMAELIARVRRGELAYADVLANISSLPTSDARDVALSYIQSEVGGKRAPNPESKFRMDEGMFGYSDRDARVMGTMESPLPDRESYPAGKQGRELFEREFMDTLDFNDSIYYGKNPVVPDASATDQGILANLGMPTREQGQAADRARIERIRSKLSPSLGSIDASDIDRSIAGMVSERAPRSGGIQDFIAAPQRAADLFGTGFGGADYSSPKPGTESADPIAEMLELTQSVQTDASDPRRESKSLAGAGILSGSTPSEIAAQLYDYSRPTSGARGRPVEGSLSREELIYSTLGEDYSGFMPPVLPGPAARQKFIDEVVASGRLDDKFSTDLFGTGFGGADYSQVPPSDAPQTAVVGGAEVQEAQTDRNDPRYRPDFSIMEDYFADFATGDKSVQGASPVQTQAKPKGEPKFDISDILDESRRMTQANMLMQLGAGIAGGDLSKGISAAGAAGMKGAQEQRALDIRKRLAEYQAGREDLAREEKASQFERTFGLSERELAGKMEISKDVTAREGLRGLLALYETAFGEEKEQLKARIMPLINRLLGEEQPADFGGMQTGRQDYSGFSIRR